jgi:adenylate cyclase
VLYRFNDFSLDLIRGSLRTSTEDIELRPKSFAVLQYLVENAGRLVAKEEILATLWPRVTVSDESLARCISDIRTAICDHDRTIIKTIPRRGYIFTAGVTPAKEPDWERVSASNVDQIVEGPSLAVLPFTNMSRHFEQDFFADGVAEDILTELSKLRWLFVIARSSSFTYRDRAIDCKTVGRELGVRYILEGSVRRAGSRVRVTSQLIDAATGAHLWAERFDHEEADIFDVQDEITAAVATAIEPAIVEAERKRAARRRPEDLRAWEAYLRGMWHMSHRDVENLALAQEYFQRAMRLDPTFAPGFSALAWSYSMASSVFSTMSIAEGCKLSEPLARKAIALDENDPNSYARLALTLFLKGDKAAAIKFADHALSIAPRNAEALGVKGAALVYSGRGKEGRDAIQQYLRANPRDPARAIRLAQYAGSQYLDRDYEGAVATAEEGVRLFPGHPLCYRWLAASLGQLGRIAEARLALKQLTAIAPSFAAEHINQRPAHMRVTDQEHMLEGLRMAGWQEVQTDRE